MCDPDGTRNLRYSGKIGGRNTRIKSELGVKTFFIEPGSPWENGCIESFNGKIRDELLNGEIFNTILNVNVLGR